MTPKPLKAALVIIGNEILSGRTQDTNTKYIAEKLGEKGISLVEIRVVPDIESKIIEAVHALRDKVDYLFTTGGIGPTHDDITSESIAKAFNVGWGVDGAARKVLEAHYGADNLTEARLKMAKIPQGAALIHNPVSAAPGFIIGNVYVMAGVPAIMQGMLDGILPGLRSGAVVHSVSIACNLPESAIAQNLSALQGRFADVDIGSYPRFGMSGPALNLVLRSTDTALLERATGELMEIVTAMGDKPARF